MIQLNADLIMVLHVECDPNYHVGPVSNGFLRVIPIISGQVDGKIKGRVVPGGADWNRQMMDGSMHVFAKYMLQTDDGVYISIENEGFIHDRDNKNRIKTRPSFEVANDSKYSWLNHGVYVGSLEEGHVKDSVLIHIYKLA